MKKVSLLQDLRREYKPRMPSVLEEDFSNISIHETSKKDVGATIIDAFKHTASQSFLEVTVGETIKKEHKQKKIGVILSGGQAAGGHNVISSLFDAMKKANPSSSLYGFLGGPAGLIDGKYKELTADIINEYRNTGGFDIIGSGRTKIQTDEQIGVAVANAKKMDLDGLVIIGGDDSNTNAAFLAEHFLENGLKTKVVGVPKTIDGDLKNEHIEASFGFDTATKVYSELIGNIARDAVSAKKYWHFIKLMGRSASHIALECALQTRPNVCLISEEVEEKKMTLKMIATEIAERIVERSKNGEDFGIVLIPEGLIEFVPEMKALITELNEMMGSSKFDSLKTMEDKNEAVKGKLTSSSSKLFESLPKDLAAQLLIDRDPHGNVQVSRIETEKLIIYFVEKELKVLNNLVSAYFDLAELNAIEEREMRMADFVRELDNILRTTGRNVLDNAGQILHEQAKKKAIAEYKKYKSKSLSNVEKDYLNSITMLEQKAKKGNRIKQ